MKEVCDFMKNVLWTGGWDSTFRVLELAITKKEVVQPHYILDNERASTPQELQAMEQIKELMIRKFPYTKGLILDHRFMNKNDIPPTKPSRRILISYYQCRILARNMNGWAGMPIQTD
jgi:hypothetical protein